MEFQKLKLDQFSTYQTINEPNDFNPPLEKSDQAQVYFAFVSNIEDTLHALNMIQNNQTHKENRAFFIFKKGNKSFGRDHVYNIVMQHGGFVRKAPMLASLNKEYSVFCFMLKV